MKLANPLFIISLSVFMLSGCLSPVKTDKINAYVLNAEPEHTAKGRMRTTTMLVLMPQTDPVYNTTQMAYTIKPYQVSYFGINQWAETPAQMLQPLLVQTLQKTHHYHAVVNAPYGGQYDYALSTQILKLQQDFTHIPALLRLDVEVQLSRASSNRIIATQHYTINQPLPQNSPYGGVIAANRAFVEFLNKIAILCINKA